MMLERCRKWIEDALEYSGGTHTFEDVEQGIYEKRLQLWPAERGCAVTEIVVYPRIKVLHVFLAGGEMDQIIDMINSAVEWSKAQGCTSMTISGRHGWQKVLAEYGFKPVMTVLKKEYSE
jgi:hypothetical protein